MFLLPTIKVNFRTKDSSLITARGLVDSGSQVSLINSQLMENLNIPTFNYDLNVTALGQVTIITAVMPYFLWSTI